MNLLLFGLLFIPLNQTVFSEDWVNREVTGLEMVYIKGGMLEMGNPDGKKDEKAHHPVRELQNVGGNIYLTQRLAYDCPYGFLNLGFGWFAVYRPAAKSNKYKRLFT